MLHNCICGMFSHLLTADLTGFTAVLSAKMPKYLTNSIKIFIIAE